MHLHYIIDGYNLIHAIPSLKNTLQHDAMLAREQLIEFVACYALKKKLRCTIVFDGVKPTTSHLQKQHAPVHIVFAAPRSADDKIKLLIEQSKNRSLLVIISSDHEIINFAKICSCTTHTSKHFANVLFSTEVIHQDEKGEQQLSSAQVKEWLKIFEQKNT